MAIILAIEAASDYCSIAIDDGKHQFQEVLPAARSHSKLLYPMLNRLFSDSGYRPNQLDAVSFGKGPGSFTGLRIAAATAQGIGFANDIPLLPVSTLQAMAQQAHEEGEATSVVTLLDARMQEFYGGEYVLENGIMQPVRDDFIASIEATPKALQLTKTSELYCSSELLSQLSTDWQTISDNLQTERILEARYLLPKAKAMLTEQQGCQPEDIELVYLREQSHWKTIKQQKESKQ